MPPIYNGSIKTKTVYESLKTHIFWTMNNLLIINNATDSLIYSILADLSMYKHCKIININTLKTIIYYYMLIGADFCIHAFL